MEKLEGKIERVYALNGRRVLVLRAGCTGGIEEGETVRVHLRGGPVDVNVVTVAWGSSFNVHSPPVTLIVDGLSEDEIDPGTSVEGL